MHKGKEWLKETLKKRMNYWELNVAGEDYGRGRSDETRELLKAIDQLEEPEQEKVVIPQFVANEIERYDNMLDMLSGEYFNSSFEEIDDDGLLIWIDENRETFARAWLDGYTIQKEKEKLYQVLDKEGYVMMRKYKGDVVRVNATMKPSEYPYWQKEKLGLTEQEIKAIDERFWAFAEEITE